VTTSHPAFFDPAPRAGVASPLPSRHNAHATSGRTALQRTFNDLARPAEVNDDPVVTVTLVALLSTLSELQSRFLQISELQPLYATATGGLIMVMGFLVLFRHDAGWGGVGILALYLQERCGWRAGKVQMAVDCCILLAALATMEPLRVLSSVAGAVTLNLVLAMNHRPGRYMVA